MEEQIFSLDEEPETEEGGETSEETEEMPAGETESRLDDEEEEDGDEAE